MYSLNCSSSQNVLAKTPGRRADSSMSKTPKLTQGPTLGKPSTWKSPGVCAPQNRKVGNTLGDRLMPSRSTTDFEAAHFKMTSEDSSDSRVLSYKTTKVPAPCEAYVNHQKVNPLFLISRTRLIIAIVVSRPYIRPHPRPRRSRAADSFRTALIVFWTHLDLLTTIVSDAA